VFESPTRPRSQVEHPSTPISSARSLAAGESNSGTGRPIRPGARPPTTAAAVIGSPSHPPRPNAAESSRTSRCAHREAAISGRLVSDMARAAERADAPNATLQPPRPLDVRHRRHPPRCPASALTRNRRAKRRRVRDPLAAHSHTHLLVAGLTVSEVEALLEQLQNVFLSGLKQAAEKLPVSMMPTAELCCLAPGQRDGPVAGAVRLAGLPIWLPLLVTQRRRVSAQPALAPLTNFSGWDVLPARSGADTSRWCYAEPTAAAIQKRVSGA
jgi:hypothetical protein